MLFGTIFLLGFLAGQKKLGEIRRAWRSEKKLILLLGLGALPAALLLQYYTVALTSAIHLAIIVNLQVIFVLFFMAVAFKVKIRWQALVGAIIAFGGIYEVLAGPTPAEGFFAAATFWGDLLGIVIAALWASYTAFGKKLVDEYDPVAVTVILFTLSLGPALALSLAEGGMAAIGSLDGTDWIMILFIGVCCEGIGFAIWYKACREMSSENVALFNYVSPLVAILLGVFWLGESFTIVTGIGFVLTIVGLYVAARPSGPSTRATRPPEQPLSQENS
jgi:drug/metabolite transporter (DMT)-like permease